MPIEDKFKQNTAFSSSYRKKNVTLRSKLYNELMSNTPTLRTSSNKRMTG